MFRGQVSRIQRRLGSLISKYLLVDDWMKMFGAQESLDESERCRVSVVEITLTLEYIYR